MIYIFAAHPEPCADLPFPRLYAFPRKPASPPAESFVILDSGAYGLHQQGRTMDERYMRLLARYYAARTGPQVVGIAPDVFLNPRQSLANFRAWVHAGRPPVAPVLQCSRFKRLDLFDLLKQSDVYLRYRHQIPTLCGHPFLAFSNPGLKARECGVLPRLTERIRNAWGDVWIHNLGAGWSPRDIQEWAALGCFDSIDSIAYYTDAQRGLLWSQDGVIRQDGRDWHTLALLNAETALHSR